MRVNSDGIHTWKNRCVAGSRATGYEDVISSYNIISVADFNRLSEERQKEYVATVLSLIRERNIYPIYYYSEQGIIDELIKCFETKVLFTGPALVEHSRAGNTLIDFMFPNLHLATSGNNVNNHMYGRFYDDFKLSKCLMRHMKNYRFTSMRTLFFMYGRYFWPTPTNFSAMRAKAIYERFCPPGGVVYDFAAGYGGRMIGALTSANNYTYIGVDANKETVHNLNILGSKIDQVRSSTYEVHHATSEDFLLPANSVDFVFSCPPYFGLEIYAKDSMQSYFRYPAYSNWLLKYAEATLANAYGALKSGGYLAVVIAKNIHCKNVLYTLGKDWHEATLRTGFKYENTFALNTLSRKETKNAEVLLLYKK